MFALLPLRYVTIQGDASWRQDVAAVFASDFSSAWPRSVVELFLVSCVLSDVAGYSMSAETGIWAI